MLWGMTVVVIRTAAIGSQRTLRNCVFRPLCTFGVVSGISAVSAWDSVLAPGKGSIEPCKA